MEEKFSSHLELVKTIFSALIVDHYHYVDCVGVCFAVVVCVYYWLLTKYAGISVRPLMFYLFQWKMTVGAAGLWSWGEHSGSAQSFSLFL